MPLINLAQKSTNIPRFKRSVMRNRTEIAIGTLPEAKRDMDIEVFGLTHILHESIIMQQTANRSEEVSMERTVTYFEHAGERNTQDCLTVVHKMLCEGRYRHVVVASTWGNTGAHFAEALRDSGCSVVVVTHNAGFKEPNSFELSEQNRSRILAAGAKIYTGTILTHSIETAFAQKFQGMYPTHVVAASLRRFGEGTKVCCEIVMMAADAGLIPEGEEIIAVAGTGKGADTVLLVRSAVSKRFFDLKVLEVLAKPRG